MNSYDEALSDYQCDENREASRLTMNSCDEAHSDHQRDENGEALRLTPFISPLWVS